MERSVSYAVRDDYDSDLLNRIIADTGKWIHGCVMVEVWVLNEFGTHLCREEGGWWMVPRFHNWNCLESVVREDERAPCNVCKLVNPSHPNYVQPRPVSAGVGLPGALWSEIHRKRLTRREIRRSSSLSAGGTSFRRLSNFNSSDDMNSIDGTLAPKSTTATTEIVWKHAKQLSQDTDYPFDRRLKLIADCNVGLVGGVPFFNSAAQGLVIFMIKDGIDERKVFSLSNEKYLKSATKLIGSSFRVREPRHEAVRTRRKEFKESLMSAKTKIRSLLSLGVDLSAETLVIPDEVERPPSSIKKCMDSIPRTQCMEDTSHRIQGYTKKCMGAAVTPPPPMNDRQAIWTFFGVFISLAIVTKIDKEIIGSTTAENAMVVGLFGSFLALTFGQPAAPAAQPPTAIFGQLICMIVGLCFAYISTEETDGTYFPSWLRSPLACATAITIMLKLGVNHPPAGGAAIAFSSGSVGWNNLVFSIIGYCMAIIIASLINNLSMERQYPTCWGFKYYYGKITSVFRNRLYPKRKSQGDSDDSNNTNNTSDSNDDNDNNSNGNSNNNNNNNNEEKKSNTDHVDDTSIETPSSSMDSGNEQPSGLFGLKHLVMSIVSYSLAFIFSSVFVMNLTSKERQYPKFLGFQYIYSKFEKRTQAMWDSLPPTPIPEDDGGEDWDDALTKDHVKVETKSVPINTDNSSLDSNMVAKKSVAFDAGHPVRNKSYIDKVRV